MTTFCKTARKTAPTGDEEAVELAGMKSIDEGTPQVLQQLDLCS
jgi:hypothetical protein